MAPAISSKSGRSYSDDKRKYDRAYYAAHRERRLAEFRRRYQAHRADVLAQRQAHYLANREKLVAVQRYKCWNVPAYRARRHAWERSWRLRNPGRRAINNYVHAAVAEMLRDAEEGREIRLDGKEK